MTRETILIVGSALAALIVAHLGVFAFDLANASNGLTQNLVRMEVCLILPAILSVAISSRFYSRAKSFWFQPLFGQASLVSISAYPIFFLLSAIASLFYGFSQGQGGGMEVVLLTFIFSALTMFLGVAFTIIPAVIAELFVVKMALRFGEAKQTPGAAL